MSQKRVYIVDPATGTMKAAWGPNEPWGEVTSARIGGELVTGVSGSNRVLGRREAQADATRARRVA